MLIYKKSCKISLKTLQKTIFPKNPFYFPNGNLSQPKKILKKLQNSKNSNKNFKDTHPKKSDFPMN